MTVQYESEACGFYSENDILWYIRYKIDENRYNYGIEYYIYTIVDEIKWECLCTILPGDNHNSHS